MMAIGSKTGLSSINATANCN
ncbi:MAG: hypothetical protein ACD_23C00734G0004, partial [uncultured bacterium]